MVKLNEKGVTLIELILVISLITIIITPIFSFFIMNFKTFNKEDKKIELSYESQTALESIMEKAIVSKGVKYYTQSDGKMTIEFSGLEKTEKFSLSNNTLYYYYGSNNSTKLPIANYIDNIIIEALQEGKDIEEANAINIVLKLSKDDIKYETESSVLFRNNSN